MENLVQIAMQNVNFAAIMPSLVLGLFRHGPAAGQCLSAPRENDACRMAQHSRIDHYGGCFRRHLDSRRQHDRAGELADRFRRQRRDSTILPPSSISSFLLPPA